MPDNIINQLVFEIDEIEKHISILGSDEDKVNYLKWLRLTLYLICYNASDKVIDTYISSPETRKKYERIPYSHIADIHQTHISRSEFILLLRHIDGNLLPFVKAELLKLDMDVKEEEGILIKDYEVFNFDQDKVLNHSNGLKEDRVLYLEAVKKDYEQYLEKEIEDNPFLDFNYEFFNDPFIRNLDERIIAIKRYPEREFPNLVVEVVEKVIEKVTPEIFKMEPTLFEFDIYRIKEHAKGLNNPIEQIKYLEFVKKEAKQNIGLFDEFEHYSFISTIDSDIEYYTKILTLPKMTSDKTIQIESAPKEIIKLHWQDENSLVPYLFKLLKDEGLISGGDFENRKQFIEQTILKENGEVFTINEVSAYEYSFKYINKKGTPRKHSKVERVANQLKSKSLDLKSEKRKPKQ